MIHTSKSLRILRGIRKSQYLYHTIDHICVLSEFKPSFIVPKLSVDKKMTQPILNGYVENLMLECEGSTADRAKKVASLLTDEYGFSEDGKVNLARKLGHLWDKRRNIWRNATEDQKEDWRKKVFIDSSDKENVNHGGRPLKHLVTLLANILRTLSLINCS